MNHDIYKSGQVARYHCNPTMSLFRQTNADHQWGCVILILMLHPNPSVSLIRAAATHDVGEIGSGDLSHQVKQANPEHAANHDALEQYVSEEMGCPRPYLSEGEKDWLKFADRLEAYLYMRMYGQSAQWGEEHLSDLRLRAQNLKVSNRFEELINGQ